ncbi:hypothetical protein ACTWP5_04430 [Streptomyces sp. 4N509B]|uniref:hypothetical protein n=1 Tax=Streptomyces sp. 4N509B TaxID=3457413 RepID=UPI003FD24B2C
MRSRTASLTRRQLVRLSSATAATTALALAGTGPVAAAPRPPELPEVPGMSGDRVANEFWYQLDLATLYEPSHQTQAAYDMITDHIGHIESGMRLKWLALAAEPDYPRGFVELMRPVRAGLVTLSRLQLGVLDRYYAPWRHHDVARAFGWFGEGVLYDPRGHAPFLVHTMNTVRDEPPPGYHTWFAYMRAMILLDVDADRWARLAPALAFAWALQTAARPAQDRPNPGLPRRTVRELARIWLPKDVTRLDEDFRSFPFPEGMS